MIVMKVTLICTHVFRQFLSQFWTDIYEIVYELSSIPPPNTVIFSFKNTMLLNK